METRETCNTASGFLILALSPDYLTYLSQSSKTYCRWVWSGDFGAASITTEPLYPNMNTPLLRISVSSRFWWRGVGDTFEVFSDISATTALMREEMLGYTGNTNGDMRFLTTTEVEYWFDRVKKIGEAFLIWSFATLFLYDWCIIDSLLKYSITISINKLISEPYRRKLRPIICPRRSTHCVRMYFL